MSYKKKQSKHFLVSTKIHMASRRNFGRPKKRRNIQYL